MDRAVPYFPSKVMEYLGRPGEGRVFSCALGTRFPWVRQPVTDTRSTTLGLLLGFSI